MPNTFHISTGDKWLPLQICGVMIFLIFIFALMLAGVITIEGEGAIVVLFTPCIVCFLIGYCCKQCCCTYYNVDIIMADNSLKIKRRSCVCRSTKTYNLDEIDKISLYCCDDEKKQKYKLDIIFNDNERKTLLVINHELTDVEVKYFQKVVNHYIRYENLDYFFI